jgi:hypothetical protein
MVEEDKYAVVELLKSMYSNEITSETDYQLVLTFQVLIPFIFSLFLPFIFPSLLLFSSFFSLYCNLSIPLFVICLLILFYCKNTEVQVDLGDEISVKLRCPPWMDKKTYSTVIQDMPADVFEAVMFAQQLIPPEILTGSHYS